MHQMKPPLSHREAPARSDAGSALAGVFLVSSVVLVTAIAAYVFIFKIYPKFLPGGDYPKIVLMLPILAVGGAYAWVATVVLERMGFVLPAYLIPKDLEKKG